MQIRVRSCVPATPNEPHVLKYALHQDHNEKPAAGNKLAVGKNLTILVSFFFFFFLNVTSSRSPLYNDLNHMTVFSEIFIFFCLFAVTEKQLVKEPLNAL